MKARWITSIAAAAALSFSVGTAFAQDSQGASPLSGRKGGTGNSFMQFTGPATSMKTFTLPNASDTIATLTGSQTLTNKTFNCANNTCTVRIASDVTGIGSGCVTFLVTPSSANLRGCLTDEVGTGAFYTVGGALGTPASATLTNATGLPPGGLTAQAAYTFLCNNSGSSAVPSACDVTAFTSKPAPVSGDIVLIQDSAASNAYKKTTVGALASAGSVASIAGNTGAFTLSNGITNSTNDIRRSLNEASLIAHPANPASTGSTSAVMMGLGVSSCRITPVYSTRLYVTIDGAVVNNTTGNVSTIVMRYGTGSGPANGAPFTGSQASNATGYGNGGATFQTGFSKTAIITGLTPCVAVWLDLSMSASANTSTMSGVTCTAMEF